MFTEVLWGFPLISLIFGILTIVTLIGTIVYAILTLRRKGRNPSFTLPEIGIMTGVMTALLFAFTALGFTLSFQHGQMLNQLEHFGKTLDEILERLDQISKRLEEIRDLLK